MTGRPDLTSARLRYEPLEPRHAALLAAALTDPRVNAHFAEGGPATPGELEASFARKIAGARDYPGELWLDFAVRLSGSETYIGRVEATVQGRDAELAYLIGPVFWGAG